LAPSGYRKTRASAQQQRPLGPGGVLGTEHRVHPARRLEVERREAHAALDRSYDEEHVPQRERAIAGDGRRGGDAPACLREALRSPITTAARQARPHRATRRRLWGQGSHLSRARSLDGIALAAELLGGWPDSPPPPEVTDRLPLARRVERRVALAPRWIERSLTLALALTREVARRHAPQERAAAAIDRGGRGARVARAVDAA